MVELKPCPFCGRMPIIQDCGDYGYFVTCRCGIEQTKLYAQKCDAVKHWNRRKTEPQTLTYNPTSVNNLWEKPTNPYVVEDEPQMRDATAEERQSVRNYIENNLRIEDEPQTERSE